jgi:endonuclease-3 related protein
MVADEYLRPMATRHRLAREGATYGELRRLGVAAFDGDAAEDFPVLSNEFHALVVAVGKRHCSREPKCAGCPLEGFL